MKVAPDLREAEATPELARSGGGELASRGADPGDRSSALADAPRDHSLEVGAASPRPRRSAATLVSGESVDDDFVVRRADLRAGSRGSRPSSSDELVLELQDRTGTLVGRLAVENGPGATALVERLRSSPYARIRGSVHTVVLERPARQPGARSLSGEGERDRSERSERSEREDRDGKGALDKGLEVRVDSLVPLTRAQVDLRQLFDHSPEDPDALLGQLRAAYLTECKNVFVRRVLLAFLDDASLVGKLRHAPAASSYHHSYVGGLIEHIASLTRLVLQVVKTYPRLDVDLMLAGVFLHDLGKVDELGWERGFRYTDRGQLVGHIAIGVLLLEDKVRAIAGFPDELRDVLHHLILSHHGTREFGSPVVPATPEAIALHHLDNLDGKLWSAWKAQDEPGGEGDWSPFSRHLGRKVYRGNTTGD